RPYSSLLLRFLSCRHHQSQHSRSPHSRALCSKAGWRWLWLWTSYLVYCLDFSFFPQIPDCVKRRCGSLGGPSSVFPDPNAAVEPDVYAGCHFLYYFVCLFFCHAV